MLREALKTTNEHECGSCSLVVFRMCQPSIVSSVSILSNVGFGWGVKLNPFGSGTLRTLSTT